MWTPSTRISHSCAWILLLHHLSISNNSIIIVNSSRNPRLQNPQLHTHANQESELVQSVIHSKHILDKLPPTISAISALVSFILELPKLFWIRNQHKGYPLYGTLDPEKTRRVLFDYDKNASLIHWRESARYILRSPFTSRVSFLVSCLFLFPPKVSILATNCCSIIVPTHLCPVLFILFSIQHHRYSVVPSRPGKIKNEIHLLTS